MGFTNVGKHNMKFIFSAKNILYVYFIFYLEMTLVLIPIPSEAIWFVYQLFNYVCWVPTSWLQVSHFYLGVGVRIATQFERGWHVEQDIL